MSAILFWSSLAIAFQTVLSQSEESKPLFSDAVYLGCGIGLGLGIPFISLLCTFACLEAWHTGLLAYVNLEKLMNTIADFQVKLLGGYGQTGFRGKLIRWINYWRPDGWQPNHNKAVPEGWDFQPMAGPLPLMQFAQPMEIVHTVEFVQPMELAQPMELFVLPPVYPSSPMGMNKTLFFG